mmetsp:Transcript_45741/g.90096  ORF Transcript_45741/g.90096 Transcript_45741/m.90096 type:complete len:125 (-) Transcript_45741:662-1036(-)
MQTLIAENMLIEAPTFFHLFMHSYELINFLASLDVCLHVRLSVCLFATRFVCCACLCVHGGMQVDPFIRSLKRLKKLRGERSIKPRRQEEIMVARGGTRDEQEGETERERDREREREQGHEDGG